MKHEIAKPNIKKSFLKTYDWTFLFLPHRKLPQVFCCESKYLNRATFTFFFSWSPPMIILQFISSSVSWFCPYVWNAHNMWCVCFFSSNLILTSKFSTLFHIFRRSFTQICYEYIVWWIDNISGIRNEKKKSNEKSAKNFALCKF